jgi:hypothetical protein
MVRRRATSSAPRSPSPTGKAVRVASRARRALAPTAPAAGGRWPPLAPWERTAILGVLWVEVASNFGNGAVGRFSPEAGLAPLSAAAPGPVGAEVVRWFGAMNVVVGYVLLRALAHPAALPPLLEGLCVGDVIYCAALWPFAASYGALPGIAAPYALTAVMFAARARYLLGERWDGAQPLRLWAPPPPAGGLAAALDAPAEGR